MSKRFQHSRGFTLVELMISLGIALLLIYGVNLIFRAVTDTIKTGNALSHATRRMRAIQTTLSNDIEGQQYDRDLSAIGPTAIIPDLRQTGILPIETLDPGNLITPPQDQARQPAITIYNRRQVAYLNADDQANDADGNILTVDLDGDGVEENYATADAVLNRRLHRVDTFSFFAGGTFVPKAGRFGTSRQLYQDLDPFPNAWIQYGHALQADSTTPLSTYTEFQPVPVGKFYQPGQDTPTTNTKNYYAADWVLARMAMCIKWRDPGLAPGDPGYVRVNQTGGLHYAFFGESAAMPTVIGRNNRDVRPSGTGVITAGPPVTLPPDPGDIAMSPQAHITSSLNDVIGVILGGYTQSTSPVGTWGGSTFNIATATGLLYRFANAPAVGATSWWHQMMYQDDAGTIPLRFNALSAIAKPVEADNQIGMREKAAIVAPFLASGCTQFIVEFAGDFLTQDPVTGAVSGSIAPDGVIDFDIVGGVRQTQWYGLSRDMDGDGVVAVTGGNANGDVVPVFAKAGRTAFGGADFPYERNWVTGLEYVVAFGPAELYGAAPAPRKPSLIRVTVGLVDAGGSLPSGFTRQMIYKVR